VTRGESRLKFGVERGDAETRDVGKRDLQGISSAMESGVVGIKQS